MEHSHQFRKVYFNFLLVIFRNVVVSQKFLKFPLYEFLGLVLIDPSVKLAPCFFRVKIPLIILDLFKVVFFPPVVLFPLSKFSLIIVILIKILFQIGLSIFLCSQVKFYLSFPPSLRIQFDLFSVNAFRLIAIELVNFFIVPFGIFQQILSFLLALRQHVLLFNVLSRLNSFVLRFSEVLGISSWHLAPTNIVLMR